MSGHWEYREFTEYLDKYTKNQSFFCLVQDWNNAWGTTPIPTYDIVDPIRRGVEGLLARITPNGWEPIEPIDPVRLWQARRVGWKRKETIMSMIFGTSFDFYITHVNLNCRRWVEDDKTKMERTKESAIACLDRGLDLEMLRQYEDALAAYNEAIRLAPQDAIAYYRKGVLLENLSQYEDALAAYNEAIRLAPQDANTYYRKASILYRLGRKEDAQAAANEAIRLKP